MAQKWHSIFQSIARVGKAVRPSVFESHPLRQFSRPLQGGIFLVITSFFGNLAIQIFFQKIGNCAISESMFSEKNGTKMARRNDFRQFGLCHFRKAIKRPPQFGTAFLFSIWFFPQGLNSCPEDLRYAVLVFILFYELNKIPVVRNSQADGISLIIRLVPSVFYFWTCAAHIYAPLLYFESINRAADFVNCFPGSPPVLPQ